MTKENAVGGTITTSSGTAATVVVDGSKTCRNTNSKLEQKNENRTEYRGPWHTLKRPTIACIVFYDPSESHPHFT